MKILITGATGLIGKELGKQLVKAGHQLRVLSRSPDKAREQLPFPAEIFAWAGGGAEVPASAVVDVEIIINLAGESIADGRWTEARKKRMRESRILGTRSLIEALRKQSPAHQKLKKFVQGSAIGIYGNRGDEVLTEASSQGRGFLVDLVQEWEAESELVRQASPEVRLCKVRTGLVLSRHEGALPKLFPLFNAGMGGKLATGSQWMSWIHIEDIVRLFEFCALDPKADGIYNGTAPEPARNDRFTIELARVLERPVSLPAPKFALRLVLGEMSEIVLDSARVLPQAALEAGFKFRFPELVPALKQLCAPVRGGQHELYAEQWVPKKPREIFPYFSAETNLEELTPPFLGFKVIGKSPGEMHAGTKIDYRLSVHGIPMKWKTEIEEWVPEKRFVDNQVKGPYARWHHVHEFHEFAGGTLMTDCVQYRLPLGWLGDIAAHWRVRRDVKSIFAYRRKKVSEMWSSSKGGADAPESEISPS